MEDNALACSRCNMRRQGAMPDWKKYGMLWCPKCAPVEDRCANCIGGELAPLS